jgi:DNA-directed RNA polymerase specialized sigma24 family protein
MRNSYTPRHVRALVEEYAMVRERADTSTPSRIISILELADLHRVLPRLSLKYWEVVLVHGMLGYTQEQASAILQISQQAVSKRYRLALEDLTYYINGGEDDF